MNQLSDKEYKQICNKFFKEHQWERINYVNHSRIGQSPIFIIDKSINDPIIHLYDTYQDMINDIRKIVEKDLINNDGYTDSFYLSLEDIDNLDLQSYINADNDIEKILHDAKNAINF